MSEITDEMEEQSYEAMRGTAKEAISIEESGKGLTTPKRHGSGDISVDTPSKKRRLTFEDNTGIVRELIPSILHSAMDEEQPPTILESQLELESLHSSIILAQRRQKMSRMIDKNTMLNRDIIIACCRNVTVFTRKLEPPVLMIPTVIKLLTQPSMCTSSIREKVWCDSLRKLFNDHITGPFTRETDHGKSHEAIRVLDTISKSEDPLTEISSAIGTMAIDQMEHSKTFEKVLPETAEKVPPLIEGMDTLEKVDDTSVGVHLPEITAMDVDTIQEEDIGESAANLVQRKELVKSRKQVVVSTPKRSVTYIESAHSMSSSPPSTCLTKHDLCALLEVLWLDKDYIQFTELLSPNDYTRLDAAVSFLYLLEFHTERKMILKQASPYSSIWIQRHMSYMHARDM
ncbi:hypothetical protein KM043_008645 [Ampulex compressa]|nr:hypothetical protein KM043_008645 [Ampulex compressa]